LKKKSNIGFSNFKEEDKKRECHPAKTTPTIKPTSEKIVLMKPDIIPLTTERAKRIIITISNQFMAQSYKKQSINTISSS